MQSFPRRQFLVVLAGVGAGCAGDGGGQATTSTPTTESTTTTGETETTVETTTPETTTTTASLGTGYSSYRPANGVFVLVEYVVTNDGEESVNVARGDVALVDADGTVFEVDAQDTARLPPGKGQYQPAERDLIPGQRLSGWVVFDVPDVDREWRLRVARLDSSTPPDFVMLEDLEHPS